jgi:hypothetical protein
LIPNEGRLVNWGRELEDTWGRRCKAPVLSPRSFNQLWKEKRDKIIFKLLARRKDYIVISYIVNVILKVGERQYFR